jgi:hypothetical protein
MYSRRMTAGVHRARPHQGVLDRDAAHPDPLPRLRGDPGRDGPEDRRAAAARRRRHDRKALRAARRGARRDRGQAEEGTVGLEGPPLVARGAASGGGPDSHERGASQGSPRQEDQRIPDPRAGQAREGERRVLLDHGLRLHRPEPAPVGHQPHLDPAEDGGAGASGRPCSGAREAHRPEALQGDREGNGRGEGRRNPRGDRLPHPDVLDLLHVRLPGDARGDRGEEQPDRRDHHRVGAADGVDAGQDHRHRPRGPDAVFRRSSR